jgi:hexosaminidase
MQIRKTFILVLLVFCGVLAGQAQDTSRASYNLVPRPVSLKQEPGFFQVTAGVKIVTPAALRQQASLLRGELSVPQQGPMQGKDGVIRLALDKRGALGAEGYHLRVSPQGVRITAHEKEGLIHGMFTLVQLQQIQKDERFIPCVDITDTPRFAYRGMHLDVSRHFFPVSFILKFIDMMALYRFNTFHWHLTDGAGWRLEIKKYPLLTTEGAWRTGKDMLSWWGGDRHYSREGDPDAYGGYYTQQQAREVVRYAAARGITVIPEIEMPAHSEEVLACYPQLSCSGKPYVNAEFCIGGDSTFTFLEDVLTEVMGIFPSTYIHIGGDEASGRSWKTCPKDQALMRREGFTDVDQLQGYAVRRLDTFLRSHGRRLLGWDEILKGGLASGATVMSWRGEAGGIAAARQGHDVVMTPGAYCYFDHYQSDPATQPPAIGGYTPLAKVYRYDPVPADSLTPAQQRHIIGVQANLWTEYMPTTEQVEYMAFPRMLALAEVAWTPGQQRNYQDFMRRMQSQYLLLQRHDIHYYRPSWRVHFSVRPDYGKRADLVSLSTEQYRPHVRYTTDGTPPTAASTLYDGPFYVRGNTALEAAIFKDGTQMDSAAAFTANYDSAVGARVTYHNGGWSSSYPARGDSTLTNGVEGGLTYADGQWQGFLHDVDVTVDLGRVMPVHSLSIRFMQQKGPGVFLPASVSVLLSSDGVHYTAAGRVPRDASPDKEGLLFQRFRFALSGRKARYVRVKAPNTAGGFLFTDEIIVY